MRRMVRCEHGFAGGYCSEPSCPHAEQLRGRVTSSARRVKAFHCKECGAEGASVPVARPCGKVEHYCFGCASRLGQRKAG